VSRRRLALALVLANALVMLEADRRPTSPPAASLRAQRQAAWRAALAAGRKTYTFETRMSPPIAR
jgi:hypothetical protein